MWNKYEPFQGSFLFVMVLGRTPGASFMGLDVPILKDFINGIVK